MKGQSIWVLDTESNGEHPSEVIELAAVEIIDFKLTGRSHQWRVKPRLDVTYSATLVHGITNRDLRKCYRIEQYKRDILEILEDHPVAGHAVHVELNGLQRVFPDWKPRMALDTLRIARRAFPDIPKHNLTAVGRHLNLNDTASKMTGKKPHAAHYDALLCALILNQIAGFVSDEEQQAIIKHSDVVEIRRQKILYAEQRETKKRMKNLCQPKDFG